MEANSFLKGVKFVEVWKLKTLYTFRCVEGRNATIISAIDYEVPFARYHHDDSNQFPLQSRNEQVLQK